MNTQTVTDSRSYPSKAILGPVEFPTPLKIFKVRCEAYPEPIEMDFNEWLDKCNSGEFSATRRPVNMILAQGPNDNEPRWRFSKVWVIWDETTGHHYPVRVGLGAYGDYTIMRRNVSRLA